jgi:AcrR family transcriptional regulator
MIVQKMQRPSEEKRRLIERSAAKLFASRPYHEVKLDDVAADARIGKGTLYVYFKSKEDLYFSLIHDAFSASVERLEAQLSDRSGSAVEALRAIVSELVAFGFQHPQLFELMRHAGAPALDDARWVVKRAALTKLIHDTIVRGVRRGELIDAHPELTSQCVPGLVRSILLFGPRGVDQGTVTEHVIGLVEHGLLKQAMPGGKKRRGRGSGILLRR